MHSCDSCGFHFFWRVGNEQKFPWRAAERRGDFVVAFGRRFDSRLRVEETCDVRSQIAGNHRAKKLLLREHAAG